MFSDNDLKQIEALGISMQTIEHQLHDFKAGFPYARLQAPATKGTVSDSMKKSMNYSNSWTAKDMKLVSLFHRTPQPVCSRILNLDLADKDESPMIKISAAPVAFSARSAGILMIEENHVSCRIKH
jgi:hypothetical protein